MCFVEIQDFLFYPIEKQNKDPQETKTKTNQTKQQQNKQHTKQKPMSQKKNQINV